jgi:hypothetical protein
MAYVTRWASEHRNPNRAHAQAGQTTNLALCGAHTGSAWEDPPPARRCSECAMLDLHASGRIELRGPRSSTDTLLPDRSSIP